MVRWQQSAVTDAGGNDRAGRACLRRLKRFRTSIAAETVSLIVGTPSGGGIYDLWSRILARHLGRHIPGQPNIIVQNMAGAGGLRAAMNLYDVAPRDGSVLGVIQATAPFAPLLDPAGPQFDARRFGWIGSMTKELSFCIAMSNAKVKTLQRRPDPPPAGGQHRPRYAPRLSAADESSVRREIRGDQRLSRRQRYLPRDGARRDRGTLRRDAGRVAQLPPRLAVAGEGQPRRPDRHRIRS